MSSWTMGPWPTFVLIVLVLGFIVAIAEIIVTEMRPSRRNRVRQRGPKPADGRLAALEQLDPDSVGVVDLEALHRFEQRPDKAVAEKHGL